MFKQVLRRYLILDMDTGIVSTTSKDEFARAYAASDATIVVDLQQAGWFYTPEILHEIEDLDEGADHE